jgi:hypothetical protein
LQRSSGTALESERKNLSKCEIYALNRDAFNSVVEEYIRTKHLPALTACQIDPAPIERSKKINPDSIHFVIDVERATEKALFGRPDLQKAWFQLATGETVEPMIAQLVTSLCGRIYRGRRLEPWYYFKENSYRTKPKGAK